MTRARPFGSTMVVADVPQPENAKRKTHDIIRIIM
jgi:hypothetical protein